MADHKEVRVERLYVKVPNTDKLRKNAAGRHRRLLAAGWRETERKQQIDHIAVRYERTGHVPLKSRLPRAGQEVVRIERRPRGQSFGGGRGMGGRGGRGGGGRGGGGRGRGPGPSGRQPAQSGPSGPQPGPSAPSSAG